MNVIGLFIGVALFTLNMLIFRKENARARAPVFPFFLNTYIFVPFTQTKPWPVTSLQGSSTQDTASGGCSRVAEQPSILNPACFSIVSISDFS